MDTYTRYWIISMAGVICVAIILAGLYILAVDTLQTASVP